MNSPEPNRLTQTRGKYAAKYGHEIDDWSALFLSVTQEHFLSLETRVGKSIAAIDRAALELKGRKRHLQFHDRGQALFYGLGVTAPYSIAGIVIAVLFYILIRHGQQYVERQKILDEYPDAPAYMLIMQHGKIIKHDGVLYLQLVPLPKKGEVQIGEHYPMIPRGSVCWCHLAASKGQPVLRIFEQKRTVSAAFERIQILSNNLDFSRTIANTCKRLRT